MKTTITILLAVFALHQAHSAVIHSYDAALAPGNFNFADQVGSSDMIARDTAAGGAASGDGVLAAATTTGTDLTEAFSVSTNDTGYYRTALALSTYTFEIWTRLPSGTDPSANAVIFESGGGDNGFGFFTTSGGALEFASYSGGGTNNNLISLSTSTLNTADYLQVVGVYNTSNNLLTFQIKDVDGVTLSGTDSSGTLGTGTGNAGGLFLPGFSGNNMALGSANAGGSFASSIGSGVDLNPYGGEIALFNIYDNDAIANGDILASYNAVIPEPSTALLLGVGVAGLAFLRRRRAS